MTDEEAVERAAEAIRAFQRHRAGAGHQGPWRGTPAVEILESHLEEERSEMNSRFWRLARRTLQRVSQDA